MPSDADKKLLVTKLTKFRDDLYGGSWRLLFEAYGGSDAAISPGELARVLEDARVGNIATRSSWVNGVMSAVDTNKDGRISWDEFEGLLKNAASGGLSSLGPRGFGSRV